MRSDDSKHSSFSVPNNRNVAKLLVDRVISVLLFACFVAGFFAFSHQLLHLFISEAETSTLGASFLRMACLAVPLTSINFLISYTLQAMGKGMQSAALTFCRQGLLNIPLLIVLHLIFGLYGMIWVQLVVEIIILPISQGMYLRTFRQLGECAKAACFLMYSFNFNTNLPKVALFFMYFY